MDEIEELKDFEACPAPDLYEDLKEEGDTDANQ